MPSLLAIIMISLRAGSVSPYFNVSPPVSFVVIIPFSKSSYANPIELPTEMVSSPRSSHILSASMVKLTSSHSIGPVKAHIVSYSGPSVSTSGYLLPLGERTILPQWIMHLWQAVFFNLNLVYSSPALFMQLGRKPSLKFFVGNKPGTFVISAL